MAYTGIETYEGLKGLRAERAMYLGNTGLTSDRHAPRALNQTLQEIVSNSIDEFVAGHGDQISITIHRDNSITIQDHGRGMPKGPEDSFDDVIRAATVPHSSGKFSGSGYEASGIAGMHGIGLKATNAVSKYLTIEAICHSVALNENGEKELTGDLEHYRIHFENGGDLIESTLIKRYSKPKHIEGNHFTCRGEDIYTGTKISYLPDDGPVSEDDQQPVFESIQWVAKDLYERFQSSSFLNAGLQISFTDERFEDDQGNYTIKEWNYPEGLSDYIKELSQGQNLLKNVKTPIFIQSDCEEKGYQFYLQLALMMTDDIDCDIKSYANGVPTKEGGPHVDGFQVGLTKAINDYVQLKGHKKLKKNETISQSDVLQGWIGAFEIRIPGEIASFEGQTKEKLGTAQAKNATYKIVYEHVSNWLHDHESEANAIIEVMIEAKSSREAAIKARQDAKKARQSKNAGGKLIVSSKLKPASGKDPKKNELFIVEGDSASNIKRDTKTQAIMPLRGKIKNVHDVSLGETLKNEEISTITKVLGTGIGPAFDIKDLQYDKIIIACFTGDTKVKCLDGNAYSFEELVAKGQKEMWVYAMDENHNVVPALARNIGPTGTASELIEITLDNGEKIKSTLDHLYMTVDGDYMRADQLQIGQSLMPLHTRMNDGGYEEFYDRVSGKYIKTYRRVAEMILAKEREEAYERLKNEEHKPHQNHVAVHHKDRNKLNNLPENLDWLTSKEHFTEHGKNDSWATTYNGSEKHLADIKAARQRGAYADVTWAYTYNGSEKHLADIKAARERGAYDHVSWTYTFNGSEAQKELLKKVNASEKHIESVRLTKVLKSIRYLQDHNLEFTPANYDAYKCKCAPSFIMLEEKMSYSLDELIEMAKNLDAKKMEYYVFANKDPQVIFDAYAKDERLRDKRRHDVAKVISSLIAKGHEFNEDNYNAIRPFKTLAYQSIYKAFDSYEDAYEAGVNFNHKIVDIQVIKLEKPVIVYCMEVPKCHNFCLESGIFCHNCDADVDGQQIYTLVLTLLLKYFRPLLEEGHVYLAIPPLYRATKYVKGKPHHLQFYSEQEMNAQRDKLLKDGYQIKRFKGLGEMNPEDVGDCIANPKTRVLQKVSISDVQETLELFKILMGNDSRLRKDWISDNVDFDALYEATL